MITSKACFSRRGGGILFVGLCCFILFLFNLRLSADGARAALSLCAKTVLPSLFPFMVLSDFLLRGGIADALPAWTRRLFSFLFHIDGRGAAALLLGALCGFPVGASVTAGLLREGFIEKPDAELLLPLANLTSPAFAVGAVGIGMFGNARVGIAIYISQLIATVAVGMITRPKSAPKSFFSAEKKEAPSFAALLTSSIKSAAGAALSVTGYIVFFSILGNTIVRLCAFPLAGVIILPLLEVGSGTAATAELYSQYPGIALAAAGFAVGFAGISVLFQASALCDGTGISTRRYFINKVAVGLLTATITYIFFCIF